MSPTSSPTDFLLDTKLCPPRVPAQWVRRQRLHDALDQGRSRPVTLISAPAGYGKTTAVSQWLREKDLPAAWLSLDEQDAQLDSFVTYLLAALRTRAPGIGAASEALLQLAHLPAPEILADSLLQALQDLPSMILVIDDYHAVQNSTATHLFMNRIVQRLPEPIRLILLSRSDPPIKLALLRGRGQLLEIRGADLRFSQPEAQMLLEQTVGKVVDRQTAEVLTERTEGWAAGLCLAGLTLRESPDGETFIARYGKGDQRLVTDYLLSEVLEHMPEAQRTLLLRTSITDRFCASLVESLAGEPIAVSDGQAFLQSMWAANFFLVALDDQGIWYRYHHLFRQMLQQRLDQQFSAEEVASLHLRAGAWFEEAGLIEDAIISFLEGGDGDRASRLVERQAHMLMNQEAWRVLERWLLLLPVPYRSRPGLQAVQAILEQVRYRIGALSPLLDEAERGLLSGDFDYSADEITSWMGVVNTYRAIGFSAGITPQMILHLTEEAVRQLDPTAVYVRSIAELWHIYGLQQTGKADEAREMGRRQLAKQSGPPDARSNRLMLALGAVHYAEADIFGAREAAGVLRKMTLRTNHPISLGWANFLLGWSYYQEDLPAAAEPYFRKVLDDRRIVNMRAAVDGICGLALTQSALGRPGEAAESLDTLRDLLVEQDAYMLLPLVDSLAARISGEKAINRVFSFQIENLPDQLAADLWELPLFTRCYMVVESGESDWMDTAQVLLARCREYSASRSNKRQLMQVGALETLLHLARGERAGAAASLREAVLLGEPGGAIRIFVDWGPGLIPTFRQLRDQGVANSYVDSILAAYAGAAARPSAAPSETPRLNAGSMSREGLALAAELTNREMEVLHLLAQRLTNKEIAQQLTISPRTVKKYTLNLYRKLDVNNRRQAVVRARDVGILPAF